MATATATATAIWTRAVQLLEENDIDEEEDYGGDGGLPLWAIVLISVGGALGGALLYWSVFHYDHNFPKSNNPPHDHRRGYRRHRLGRVTSISTTWSPTIAQSQQQDEGNEENPTTTSTTLVLESQPTWDHTMNNTDPEVTSPLVVQSTFTAKKRSILKKTELELDIYQAVLAGGILRKTNTGTVTGRSVVGSENGEQSHPPSGSGPGSTPRQDPEREPEPTTTSSSHSPPRRAAVISLSPLRTSNNVMAIDATGMITAVISNINSTRGLLPLHSSELDVHVFEDTLSISSGTTTNSAAHHQHYPPPPPPPQQQLQQQQQQQQQQQHYYYQQYLGKKQESLNQQHLPQPSKTQEQLHHCDQNGSTALDDNDSSTTATDDSSSYYKDIHRKRGQGSISQQQRQQSRQTTILPITNSGRTPPHSPNKITDTSKTENELTSPPESNNNNNIINAYKPLLSPPPPFQLLASTKATPSPLSAAELLPSPSPITVASSFSPQQQQRRRRSSPNVADRASRVVSPYDSLDDEDECEDDDEYIPLERPQDQGVLHYGGDQELLHYGGVYYGSDGEGDEEGKIPNSHIVHPRPYNETPPVYGGVYYGSDNEEDQAEKEAGVLRESSATKNVNQPRSDLSAIPATTKASMLTTTAAAAVLVNPPPMDYFAGIQRTGIKHRLDVDNGGTVQTSPQHPTPRASSGGSTTGRFFVSGDRSVTSSLTNDSLGDLDFQSVASSSMMSVEEREWQRRNREDYLHPVTEDDDLHGDVSFGYK